MPYVGNIPAESYAAFNVQHFTTSATTSYTLDHAVANELDIRLVINNVIQQPGAGKAYTATGTTLTLSAATSGTDTMYCVYTGKAVQTVVPPAGSVDLTSTVTGTLPIANGGTGSTSTTFVNATANITGVVPAANLGTGTASSSTFLRGDQTYAAAGGNNTPAFNVKLSSNTDVSSGVTTVVAFNSEQVDTDNAFNTSNYRFVPQTAGKYFIAFTI